MKKLIIFMLSLIFVGSILTYVNLAAIDDITMDDFIGSSYIEEFKKVVSLEPIIELVPLEYREEVLEVIDKASNDEKLSAIVNDQANNTINDILHGTNSFNEQAFNEELLDVFDDYIVEIEEASNHTIPREIIKIKLESKIVGYNLKEKYEKAIIKVENKLSPKQKDMLAFIAKFKDNMSLYKNTALIINIVSLVLITIISAKSLFLLSILGYFLVFINKLSVNVIFAALSRKYLHSLDVSLNMKVFNYIYFYLLLLFTIGLVSSLLNKRKLSNLT